MTTWTRRGGRWCKKCQFLSTFKVEYVHVEVGGGQKRTKGGSECIEGLEGDGGLGSSECQADLEGP